MHNAMPNSLLLMTKAQWHYSHTYTCAETVTCMYIYIYNYIIYNIDRDARFNDLLRKYRQLGVIDFTAVKWLLVGPPKVGKTVTKYHLLNEIESLRQRLKHSDSTGIEAPIEMTYIDNDVAVINATDGSSEPTWTRLNIDDLIESLIQSVESQDIIDSASQEPDYLPSQASSSQLDSQDSQHKLPKEESLTVQEAEVTEESISYNVLDEFLRQIYDKMDLSKEELMKKFAQSLTVYLTDTGGQPEFHDLLPLLLQGPAFYLIFFNLAESLDDPYTIEYSSATVKNVPPYQSGHTIADTLGVIYNSFTYFSAQKETMCGVNPQILVIGTHRDKVSPEDIEAINKKLLHILQIQRGSPQYKILINATRICDTFFVAIDNTSENGQEIIELRKLLAEAVKKACKPVQVPITWLVFHLILRKKHEKAKVCTLESAIELARGCGIKECDVKSVLTYIYRKLGTILYFENASDLSQLVICNPDVIYQSISNLIFVFYQEFSLDEISCDGLIPEEYFRDLISLDNGVSLDVEHFIKFLEYFRIISFVKSSSSFFMPCLLRSIPIISNETDNSDIDPFPLIVCFPFKKRKGQRQEYRMIPVGLATALVVSLHSLPPTMFGEETVQQPWEYAPVPQFKNQYEFIAYKWFTVTLVIKGKYLELNLHVREADSELVCKLNLRFQLRKDLLTALEEVHNLFPFDLPPEIRFYCVKKAPFLHLVIYDVKDADQLKCPERSCTEKSTPINPVQKQWVVSTKYQMKCLYFIIILGRK